MDCRQELLDELGLDRTYTDMFSDFDSGYVYRSSEEYPLVVTTPREDTFNIVPLPDMETPAEVCRLLYEAREGPQVILEAVRAEAPEYADILEKNYSKPFICNLNPNRYGSVASSGWRRQKTIELGWASAIVHEIMHLCIPSDRCFAEQWKYEASAEYLTYKYYPPRWYRLDYYNIFSPDIVNTKITPQIYLAYADFPRTADEVDVMLSVKAMLAADRIVLSEAEYNEKWRSAAVTSVYQNAGSGELPAEGGNMLSYEELATFADYLIENYSLSTFLEYCLANTSFEKIYGIDYETAEAAWLEDLMGMDKN